jgi:hypothetical protein
MRASFRKLKQVVACLGFVVLLGITLPLIALGNPQVAGYPDNPRRMDTFPYYSYAPYLFTHPTQSRNEFNPIYSEDEWGARYIDWYTLENIDMRTLDFRVQLQTNEDIFNWMEPVYLTATITSSDLNIFPELRWRVQGLGTIADEGIVMVEHGVGRSTARQILPNPYISHLVFYLYFPSGQVHVSSHPIEIGNRPITPRLITEAEEKDDEGLDKEGESAPLPQTFDPITATSVGSFLLLSSIAVFAFTSKSKTRTKKKSIKES